MRLGRVWILPRNVFFYPGREWFAEGGWNRIEFHNVWRWSIGVARRK